MAYMKNDYVLFTSKAETNRPGDVEICTRIDGMDISDKELLEIKEVQKQAAQKIEKILNKEAVPDCSAGTNQ